MSESEHLLEDLHAEVEKRFAGTPLSHPRAREYYFGLKRRLGDEAIYSDGSFVARRIPFRTPARTPEDRESAIEYLSNVSDALAYEAIKQDDRLRDVPVDLLQGLARAAFQFGVELQPRGSVDA